MSTLERPPPSPAAPARPTGFRIWVVAARPATLPAAVGGRRGRARRRARRRRRRSALDTAIGCLLVALLLQVAANFANDLSDFRRGADTAGPRRARCGSRRRDS